ncbi:hypothetical protein HMPREF0083_04555 [Aneurinibacillus aneurinilyticus ATCC 12856]|uniref:Uncharacterized protein n=1 Tax=Aneurinibacillus aneurinilyticus ATCC 12856 TaxID=649747 RepID=U1WYN6_ANEAE|nr:hypothetical protein HMPREF0083_04555 [Aneurinibacillus aneurinilyticus ATCC 12856]
MVVSGQTERRAASGYTVYEPEEIQFTRSRTGECHSGLPPRFTVSSAIAS